MKIEENINIGLEPEERKSAAEILERVLADQHALYIKARNFHWNLRGGRFRSLHEFFEEQYKEIEGIIDETAERIRQLGGVSPGSMGEFLSATGLKETEGDLISGDDAIAVLVNDHEAIIRMLRESVGILEEDTSDVGTADFLTELVQKHEQMAWMLRSFID